MNLITLCAIYKGDTVTERGLRTMSFEIPPNAGKKPISVPITLLPSFAAQDTCAAGRYAVGTHMLINGRLYPHPEDGKMYVVPTQPLVSLNMGMNLNQICIAGSVGYIGEQRRQDAFNFGIMCQAPPQKSIGHTWQDSLGFKVESWGDDAERMKKFLFVGRSLSLGGTLRFESWTDKDGNQRKNYKVRVRSMQYSFFGKNQNTEEIEKKIDHEIKDIVSKNNISVKKPLPDDVPF